MTHEQKPQSAKFRTREAQIADLAFEISDWKSYDDNEDITIARAHAEEFEARGAAEQRRKDAEGAEGAEAVAWCLMTADGQIINGIHEEKRQAEAYRHRKASDTLTPLYTRPANVATGLDISAIIRAVCELPDRSSPEDQPDMVLVTPDELRLILETAQPANVTALEDRVKELEGALSYLEDEALRFADMYPQSSDMRNSFGVFASKIKAHAAAIREGGE